MNYSKAMSDYLVNFSFGKGVNWRVPKRAEGITPYLLKRIWERDNTKQKLLWEIGNSGSVTGDCFVKVAYEEPWQDSAGNFHAGRVRILPLNSSYCFPEFHPHDRTRMLRFKLKYRFWGCVDPETEALTRGGWKKVTEVTTDDELLSLDPDSDAIRWEQPEEMHAFDYAGKMHHWEGTGIDAVTTPNHRWLVERSHGRGDTYRWEREFVRSEDINRKVNERLVTGGGTPLAFALTPKWDDELVETLAWYVTEGWEHTNQTGCHSVYLAQKRPEHVATIRRLAEWWKIQGATFNEYAPKPNGVIEWYLGRGVKEALFDAAPDKQITPEFLCSLTASQARLFYETLMDGDGCRTKVVEGRTVRSERWTQLDLGRVDGFQMLCAMLGRRTRFDGEKVTAYQSRHTTTKPLAVEEVDYDGKVYCPTMPSGTWLARRNGTVWWTGNTSLEGTRQVFTYTEIITDSAIEEYVNDELIDSRPNPLGEIPVAYCPNLMVSGSPWGLSDLHDVIAINREYNEKSTQISDIVSYHASPVTVITGAKASQLEKGAKKVWGGLPADAKVFNLEGANNLNGPLAYLQLLKMAMHEVTGIPESALGQMQPISNTSGVALSIMYQPLMNKHAQKTTQYSQLLERVNDLALRTLALKEPYLFQWDPEMSGGTALKPGQDPVLDLSDPETYRTEIHWPAPLPLDVLVKLNELQAKMAIGLESKRGALRELGYEEPDAKMSEIFNELIEDAKEQASLDLMRTNLAIVQGMATGILPGEMMGDESGGVQSAGGSDVSSAGSGGAESVTGPTVDPAIAEALYTDIATKAYGTTIPQQSRR